MKRALISLAALLAACGPYMTDGDYYWVNRAGADMPVWVRGNIDSGVFLVTVHGGPGHNGQGTMLSDGFSELERDYAVVYWDQRMSGASQGNPSMDTITVDHFVADTDAVLSLIEQVYEPESLFVLGHSWGGDLALATAVDGRRAEAVDGWIFHAAAHDEQASVDASVDWMAEQIDGYIQEDKDAEFWSEVQDWYAANPDIGPCAPEHYSFVSRTTGYYYDISSYEPPPVVKLAFASPFSMGMFQNEARQVRLCPGLLANFDVSNRLLEITAPSLVLSGQEDGSVPVEIAEAVFEGLGTDASSKELVIEPGIAHAMHDEAPQVFADHVGGFIERWR